LTMTRRATAGGIASPSARVERTVEEPLPGCGVRRKRTPRRRRSVRVALRDRLACRRQRVAAAGAPPDGVLMFDASQSVRLDAIATPRRSSWRSAAAVLRTLT